MRYLCIDVLQTKIYCYKHSHTTGLALPTEKLVVLYFAEYFTFEDTFQINFVDVGNIQIL